MSTAIFASPRADYLDRSQAATYLGIAISTLALWAHSGKHRELLPFARYGKRCMYRKSDLDNFLAVQFASASAQ
jgi:predicted site-specific integrase-resolvase